MIAEGQLFLLMKEAFRRGNNIDNGVEYDEYDHAEIMKDVLKSRDRIVQITSATDGGEVNDIVGIGESGALYKWNHLKCGWRLMGLSPEVK